MRSRARRCASTCRTSPPKARQPGGLPAHARAAERPRRGVAQGVFARRLARMPKRLRLPAARRRHGPHARAVDHLDHGVRRVAVGHDGAPRPARGPAIMSWSTGTIGDAALGLQLRRGARRAQRWKLVGARARPSGAALSVAAAAQRAGRQRCARYATAAMDVSDGLAGDLGKLCRASGVAAVVDVARVPLSDGRAEASRLNQQWLETALTGGDDYRDRLCTCGPTSLRRSKPPPCRRRAGDRYRAHRGEARARVSSARRQGADLRAASFSHF